MKREFYDEPDFVKSMRLWGFDWKEHTALVPAPLMVVTGYKPNGKPNATLQSWVTFASGGDGYYCVMASVNPKKHLYESVHRTGCLVLNFPSADIYGRCLETIRNNAFEDDEITQSGLTVEDAVTVRAPRIKECFLSLECEYQWERQLCPGTDAVVLCVKVVHMAMDPDHYDESKKGRFGETGLLYNVHAPLNPETGEQEPDSLAVLKVLKA